MTDALAIAEIGMNNDQLRMRTISNNLANVNTPAFKREQVVQQSFFQILNSSIHENTLLQGPLPNARVIKDYTIGTLNKTDNPLDVALESEGFFELSSSLGAVYIRNGNFKIDERGVLTNQTGLSVMGEEGEIRLATTQPVIDKAGNVTDQDGTYLGRIKVMTIQNPEQLENLGRGMFLNNRNLFVEINEDPQMRQGFLETHNMDVTNEMVELIEVLNHFEANQKVILGYDDMLEAAINNIGNF